MVTKVQVLLIVMMICLLPIISADLFPTPTEIVSVGIGGGSGQTGVNVFIPQEIFNSSAADSNSTNYWTTLTFGVLRDVNATQFDNLANVLNIDETWIDSLWCQLIGCTMTGDIDMSNNNILNVDNITIDNNIFFGDTDHFLRKGVFGFTDLGTDAFVFAHMDEQPAGDIPFMVIANKINSVNDAVLIMTQIGLNESNSVLGNSWFVVVNNLTNNLTEYSNCFLVAGLLNKTLRVQCDSDDSGSDFVVQDDIQSFGTMFADGGIRAETLVDFIMNGEDVNIQGGALHIFDPVTFEQGVVEGDEVTVFIEDFTGGLGSFTNLQSDLGNWFVTANILCDDGDCANAIGISGVGNIIMEANISTLNINSTSLNFIYSLVNIIGANDIEVTVNNNVGSGEVIIFTDATNNVVKSSQSITLPSSMSNQSKVSIRFNCDVTNTNRQCFVDTISVNGTAIATTLTNVSGFNSVIKFSDGALAADGFPERGIFYVAENDTIVFRGNVTFENIIEQDLNVTNSITLNSSTIFDWSDIVNTPLFPSFLLANGSTPLTGDWDAGSFTIISALADFESIVVDVIAEKTPGNGVVFDNNIEFGSNNINGSGNFTTTGNIASGNISAINNIELNTGKTSGKGLTLFGSGSAQTARGGFIHMFGSSSGTDFYMFANAQTKWVLSDAPQNDGADDGIFSVSSTQVAIKSTLKVNTVGAGEFGVEVFGNNEAGADKRGGYYALDLDLGNPDFYMYLNSDGLMVFDNAKQSSSTDIGLTTLDLSSGDWIFNSGNIFIGTDNKKIFVGDSGSRGSFYQDGIDTVINPKEFGSGLLKVLGDVNITENLTVGGTIFGGSPIKFGDNIDASGQNITADFGFFDTLNVSGTIIGPGSNFAQYEFGVNDFNGNGNFITMGDGQFVNLLTAEILTDVIKTNQISERITSAGIIFNDDIIVDVIDGKTGDFRVLFRHGIDVSGTITAIGNFVISANIDAAAIELNQGRIKIDGIIAGGPASVSRGSEIQLSKGHTSTDTTTVWNYINADNFWVLDNAAQSSGTGLGVFAVDADTGDIETVGSLTADKIAIGSNILGGLASGDINVSTLYYDTLAAKSPVISCSNDWCSVGFPKHQKVLWLQKDDNWTILDIVYEGDSYTKQTFWDLVQGTQYEELSLKLNDKIQNLQDKKQTDILTQQIKDACQYRWDGSCYEIVRSLTDYNGAVEMYQVNETILIASTCIRLNGLLQIENYNCYITQNTEQLENRYRFREGCNWNENDGYYCVGREEK